MPGPSSSSAEQGESEKRLRRLKREAQQETLDNFDEEISQYSKKRPRQDDSSDDEEEDATSSSLLQQDMPSFTTSTSDAKKSFAEKMMNKMGYVSGEGLGARGQGRVDPVALSTQRGRAGLGHEGSKMLGRDLDAVWDANEEEKEVEETVKWIEACDDTRRDVSGGMETENEWIEFGAKKLVIDDETEFVDPTILKEMLDAKQVFDHLSDRELREARTRANPYETIGSAFFQNRAAMKTANMDKVFDWIFSKENVDNLTKKNPLVEDGKAENTDRAEDLFYFADVCAGPGGFSEYMLWRKAFYNAKGFGFTLRGRDDFKLGKFTASSAHYFEPFYGVAGDGDVMNPENIDALEAFIMKGTAGKGVDLMMADGGFSVEGQENIQEILSKRLYLCQLLVSLCIVRDGGNFFCKLFDVFTPFSAGLVFLLFSCYDRISIHKPHTSRPANSERYLICQGLRREEGAPTAAVRDYLKKVNRELDRLNKAKSSEDIVSIVPLDVMRDDAAFIDYLIKSNDKLAVRQTVYLRKYLSFAKNHGQIDLDQGTLRDRCLDYWQVPNRNRNRTREHRMTANPDAVLGKYTNKLFTEADWLCRPPPFGNNNILTPETDKWLHHAEFACVFLSERQGNPPELLVSTGDTVFLHSNRGRDGGWARQDQDCLRVPANTILLVEVTTGYKIAGKALEAVTPSGGLIRVLDAAVLNGDDISQLPFYERAKAIAKFCRALRLVQTEVTVGWGNRERKVQPFRLNAAAPFALGEMAALRRRFSRLVMQGEEVMVTEEHGVEIIIRGVRGVNILAEGWRMSWSVSQRLRYAFGYPPQRQRPSVFERDWMSQGVHADFWSVAIMKKNNPKPPAWTWNWIQKMDSTYGPRVIMEEERHSDGPTITSITEDIQTVERRLGKT